MGVLAGLAVLVGVALPLRNTVRLHGDAPPLTALVVQDEHGGLPCLLALTYAARAVHPDLVVWRESAAGDLSTHLAPWAQVQQCARTLPCTLVLGSMASDPRDRTRHFNTATIVAPTGTLLGTYRKRHPVQGMEGGVTPGDVSPAFATPAGRLGIAICYDFDYASISRQLVQHGAELLVVPTFDAESWSDLQHEQHARMAQARAAEVGRWVLRATSSGVSQIISPQGEVIAALPNHASAVTWARIYPLTQRTLYTRFFFLLPYLCLFLAVVLLFVGIMRRPPPFDNRAAKRNNGTFQSRRSLCWKPLICR